jgi:hypothetical protein
MSKHIKLLLTSAELVILYRALHRAGVYEHEMVKVEDRYATQHEERAADYRKLIDCVVGQTGISSESGGQ